MKIITELHGFSNSKIYIIEEENKILVRKVGNIERNISQLKIVSELGLRTPKIFDIKENHYDMEYISSLDIKSYIYSNRLEGLIDYIKSVVDQFSKTQTKLKDYTEIYQTKISYIDQSYYQNILPFTSEQLIQRLPKLLPQSLYHGDLTLENFLYDVQKREFLLIDAVSIDYDSFVFDLAKLRQDLTCKWFIRKESTYIDQKLQIILDSVFENYREYLIDELVILMLLRVLLYAQHDSFEEKYLIEWIKKLWN